MGFFTSKSEKQAIARCEELELKYNELLSENQKLKDELANLQKVVDVFSADEISSYMDYKNAALKAQNLFDEIQRDINSKIERLSTLDAEYAEKKESLIELDDTILMQEFGLYKPLYSFATSDEYKDRLSEIRERQKALIRDGEAATCSAKWTVEGSLSKGEKMTADNIKQALRSFNAECENAIDRVKFNNIDSMKKRIQKSYDTINRLNKSSTISISPIYLQLKMDELLLSVEYALKKQEEKEELKRLREEKREEQRVAREIEEKRREIEKEQKHYANTLSKLETQIKNASTPEQRELLEAKKEDIVNQIDDLSKALVDVDYRAANIKAGYVYIISNIGSFGENVYKIGMTRRLDPMDRIDELGDASVPFDFDVHAIIFSENAPALEAELHRAFDDRKVNKINSRREFFNVTIEEIEAVVRKNYDKTVDFVVTPPAEQYRKSLLDTA